MQNLRGVAFLELRLVWLPLIEQKNGTIYWNRLSDSISVRTNWSIKDAVTAMHNITDYMTR